MVSDSKRILKPYSKDDHPLLPEPKYIRLIFKKVGDLQYISHLDLQKTMGRVLIRAKIPLWYSKGFNPHPKLIFATPLSVGTQSVCELLDVRVERDIPPSVMMERLNAELTHELCILDAYEPTRDFTDIAWAEYDFEIKTSSASDNMAEQIKEIFSTSPCIVNKKTKSGYKDIDIVPLIKRIDARFDSESSIIKLHAILSAAQFQYLNPELLIGVLKEKLGILSLS